MLRRLLSVMVAAVLLFGLFTGVQKVQALDNTYYVSTAGNDVTGDGSAGNPWKTIQKAANIVVAGDTCIIRGGTYRETVTPLNSGTAENPIKFQAYTGETVTVSGADLVTGWTQHAGSIYKTPLSWNLNEKNQVFVDGVMMNLARWPNTGTDPLNGTYANIDAATATSISDADLTFGANNALAGATVWARDIYGWMAETSTVTASSSGSITFNAFATGSTPVDIYCIYDKLSLLDTACEWYVNGSNSMLYLWTPDGANPSNHTVEVKRRSNAFQLSGLSGIEISGIDIFAATITMDGSTTNCKISDGEMKYISHTSRLTDGGSSMLGSTGIIMSGTDNELRNCTLVYSAGEIVNVGGLRNNIINCLLHEGDYMGGNRSIVYCQGERSLISNNTMYNSGRFVLLLEHSKESLAQYNNLYNGLKLTKDGGIIYTFGQSSDRTRICYNQVHDISNNLGSGIYLDNGNSSYIVDHNVVWNCSDSGIRLNTPSNFNLIYNNTLYNTSGVSYWGSDYGTDMYGVKFYNNICTNTVNLTSDASAYNNFLTGNPQFVDVNNNNFRLQPTSPAINAGKAIPGVTDGYYGTAPDIGAYEYGGADWTAGYNFATPPNPVYTEINTQYMNRMNNAGFELDNNNPISWTKTGALSAVVLRFSSSAPQRTGANCVQIGSSTGADGIEQTITGLESNKEYCLSGWMRVTGGDTARMGVKDYGGEEKYTVAAADSWNRYSLTFKTGANSTSATIYFYKPGGTYFAYGDDFGLTSTGKAYEENFDDGIAQDWLQDQPNCSFERVYEYSLESTGVAAAHYSPTDFSDFKYTVTGGYVGDTTGDMNLIFRYQNSGNYYQTFISKAGSVKYLRLYKCVNGVFTRIGNEVAYDAPVNTVLSYTVEANGSSLSVTVNDGISSNTITATDSAFTSGKIGLKCFNSHVHFDNVAVYSISATPVLLYGENFDDGLAQDWVVDGATCNVENTYNVYNLENSSGVALAHYSASDFSDFRYVATGKYIGSTAGDMNLIFRYQNSGNFYQTFISEAGSLKYLRLYKCVNGVYTQIGNEIAYDALINKNLYYTVEANGSNISVTVSNGTDSKTISATDSTFTSGKIGLKCFNSHVHFDNIEVYIP